MEKENRTEKISVTIPRELAGEIRLTVPQGEVSAFFTEALEYFLKFRRQRVALAKGAGIWKDAAYPNLKTPENSSEYVASLRKNERSPAFHVNEKKTRKYEP